MPNVMEICEQSVLIPGLMRENAHEGHYKQEAVDKLIVVQQTIDPRVGQRQSEDMLAAVDILVAQEDLRAEGCH